MNKKDAILKAALRLLTEKGVHATPMSAIAKEAGTGMGTIYNYFPNKNALFNELYITIKTEEKSIFTKFDPSAGLKKQFNKYYTIAVEFYVQNPLYFHFIEQIHPSPIITDASRATGYESVAFVSQLLEFGKAKNIIKDIPTKDLMQFIGGTMISYLRLYFQEKKKCSLDIQMTMVWDAIKK